MTSALSTRQGLLTKAASRLNSLLDDTQYQPRDGPLETPTDHEERKQRIRTEQLRLRKARKVIEMEEKNVDTAQAYNEEVDTLAADTPHLTDIMEKVKNNSAKAEELLEKAIRSRTRIEENLEELEAAIYVDTSTQDTPRIKLAPVPVPTFNGKVWEWESFWSAFEYSLHSRNMDDVYKMNYLVNAMKGEALDSLKKLEMSGNTYQNGGRTFEVQIRKQRTPRYATRAALGENEGQKQVDGRPTETLKGEGIDGALLQQQVLSKFTETSGHFSSECTKGACRLCDTVGHHTSICKKLHSLSTSTSHQETGPNKGKNALANYSTTTEQRQAKFGGHYTDGQSPGRVRNCAVYEQHCYV
ncbi:hypothetical protein OSTOST_00799 [Ostertagia ostertagi]